MNLKLLWAIVTGMSLRCVAHADDFTPAPLRVPNGYTVEVAAAPPLVAHPLMADFDEQGRLYVAANCGENLPRAELEKRLPNFVQRLEDTDGDGVFDRATMFADKMTFPQGCLWFEGSLYVASSGAIWKLTDTNDDGVADNRVKLVSDFGYTGNAADVHGPFKGPDGRIYWCEGRHGHEIKDTKGTLVSRGKAARIFSCRPDGSDVQTFCTGGMDNPVEVIFDAEGQMLGTVNLMYDRPRGDCLVHWQYGGVYPRNDFAESLGSEFTRTGELLTEAHNFGHVAVSGLCKYRGHMFRADAHGSLFITQFNTNRIVKVTLADSKSTFTAQYIEDFAVSTSTDFRPTDVLEDADGSLLVIDTGGWFRIGCPQSQVEKSHIRGAIYRIRRDNGPKPDDPRGKELDWRKATLKELVRRLDDFPGTRDRAATALAAHLRANDQPYTWYALEKELKAQVSPVSRRCVEVLARVNSKASLAQLVRLTSNESDRVRQTAVRALLYADPAKLPEDESLTESLIKEMRHGSPAARREALTTAGRLAAKRPKLAKAIIQYGGEAARNRMSEHALTYAMISSEDRAGVTTGLLSDNETTRTAAAVALEVLRRPRTGVSEQLWLEIPAASVGKTLAESERQQFLKLEADLPNGDVPRGKSLFFAERIACAKCHRVAGEGGQVGPDLSTIGRSRAERDLLESLLYPSASYARGFAPYAVLTKDGKSLSGIILGESVTKIRLGVNAQNATWIDNDNIDELHAAELSIMPDDVAKKLQPQQLADLIAYLRSLK